MKYEEYLKSLKSCAFCSTEINLQKITENDSCSMMINFAPYRKYHILVIPKRHIDNIVDLTEDEALDCWRMQQLALKILMKMGYNSFASLLQQGSNTNQSVSHSHYHIIPDIKFTDEDKKMSPDRVILTPDEMASIIKDCQSELRFID